jgi:hypothetical protein
MLVSEAKVIIVFRSTENGGLKKINKKRLLPGESYQEQIY